MYYVPRRVHYLLLVSMVMNQVCHSIRFYVQPHSKRCIKHEMYPNQLAVGEYDVTSYPDTTIDMTITDSKGYAALKRDKISGKSKFAVTSDEADYFDLCFSYSAAHTSTQLPPREIYLDFKVGAEAKQYDAADHDKLSELETDLNKVEDLTNAIITDFAYLRKRELEMRSTNESTNTRLFYQTVTSIIILVFLTCWQVLYLRAYFRTRKLID